MFIMSTLKMNFIFLFVCFGSHLTFVTAAKNYTLWAGSLGKLVKLHPLSFNTKDHDGISIGKAVFEVSACCTMQL